MDLYNFAEMQAARGVYCEIVNLIENERYNLSEVHDYCAEQADKLNDCIKKPINDDDLPW